MCSEDTLKSYIEKGHYEHSILIWGATKNSKKVVNKFLEWGFSVCGYIDQKADEIGNFNGFEVYGKEILKSERYFVYVSVDGHYDNIFLYLRKLGYTEFRDFWYPNKKICLDGMSDYSDEYGNVLKTQLKMPIKVYLRGGGEVYLADSRMDESVKIESERNAVVEIGEGCVIERDCVISAADGSILSMKDNCVLSHSGLLRASCGGNLEIQESCTMQFLFAGVVSMGAKLVIGRDTMVSYHVLVRAGNSHNIFDLDAGVNLDMNNKRNVIIGEHVWVGMRSTILNGAKIGSGSIVGANSFVNKSYPNNCCIAGNPSRIIRNRVAWIRDGRELHTDAEDYEAFVY